MEEFRLGEAQVQEDEEGGQRLHEGLEATHLPVKNLFCPPCLRVSPQCQPNCLTHVISSEMSCHSESFLRYKTNISFHLSSFQLRPKLEEQKNPAPVLLVGRFKSPPGKTSKSKVHRQCTDDDKEATSVTW